MCGAPNPLTAISNVETAERDWSDSAPSYHLRVILDDATVIEGGSPWSSDVIEAIRVCVERFVFGVSGSDPAFYPC